MLPLRFRASLAVTIRTAVPQDLPALEWWGWFAQQRAIIRAAFASHERGTGVFLVATSAGHPVGQAWVDLARHGTESRAVIWAVRVLPGLRGAGIGSRLIAACEDEMRRRGIAVSEIGVEDENEAARRLYERLGYRVTGLEESSRAYPDPAGRVVEMRVRERILRKRL